MSRAKTDSTAGHRAALSLASAVFVLGVTHFYTGGPWWKALPQQPLSVVAATAEVVDIYTVHLHFPSGWIESGSALVVIGSLGEAQTVYPVKIEIDTGATAVAASPESISPAAAIVKTAGPTIRLASWSSHPSTSPKTAIRQNDESRDRQRRWFLQTGSNPQGESSYQPIDALLVAEFPRVRLWLDGASENRPASAELDQLGRRFDADILPSVTRFYGDITDVDVDGKLAICLTPKLSVLPKAGSAVQGLVQINDFQPDLPRPFSNQSDVIFLSEALRAGSLADAVLTHEAAHLAVFSRRRDVAPESMSEEDDWLNEGFAHFAETHCSNAWSNLRERVEAFHDTPALSPLVVTDAQRQGLWRQPGSRGAAWLFLRWLADEYGSELVAELARRPETGCEKISRAVGVPWPDLFRRWSVAMSRRRTAQERTVTDPSAATEISLRGTAHQTLRLTGADRSSVVWKITSPSQARLQVTLVNEADPARGTRIVR